MPNDTQYLRNLFEKEQVEDKDLMSSCPVIYINIQSFFYVQWTRLNIFREIVLVSPRQINLIIVQNYK